MKSYSFVRASVQGFSLVPTQPSSRRLVPANPLWAGWGGQAVVGEQPACRLGLNAHRASVEKPGTVASIQPLLATGAHCAGGFLP